MCPHWPRLRALLLWPWLCRPGAARGVLGGCGAPPRGAGGARSAHAGYSSVGRASDCRRLQQSDGPWFDSGWPDLSRAPSQKMRPTARGFEPLRAEPNGFLVHHLNHSVTLSLRRLRSTTGAFNAAANRDPQEHVPNARLAQPVERKALNLVVVGSSPTVGEFFPFAICSCATKREYTTRTLTPRHAIAARWPNG